jgi:hypothetical protein
VSKFEGNLNFVPFMMLINVSILRISSLLLCLIVQHSFRFFFSMFRFPCLIHHCNPLQQTFTLLGCSPYTPLTRLLIPLLSFQPPPKKKPLLGVSSPTIPYTLSTLKWPYVKHTNKQQIKTRAMINFQNNTNLHPKLDTKKLFSPPPLKRLSNYLLNPGFCLWAFGCMAS